MANWTSGFLSLYSLYVIGLVLITSQTSILVVGLPTSLSRYLSYSSCRQGHLLLYHHWTIFVVLQVSYVKYTPVVVEAWENLRVIEAKNLGFKQVTSLKTYQFLCSCLLPMDYFPAFFLFLSPFSLFFLLFSFFLRILAGEYLPKCEF